MPLILLPARNKTAIVVPANTFALFDTASLGAGAVLTADALTLTTAGTTTKGGRSTIGKTSGKWYWEFVFKSGGNAMFGVGTAAVNAATVPYTISPSTWLYGGSTGTDYSVINGAVKALTGITSFSVGNTIGVAVDLDAKTIYFYTNGVFTVSMPLTGFLATDIVYAMMCDGNSANSAAIAQATANFGATAFKYPVPTGFNPGLYN